MRVRLAVVSACKRCLHKWASKYGIRGLLNKHGKAFYQLQITLNSESVPRSGSKPAQAVTPKKKKPRK